MRTDVELAWAAGLFDGEGSIHAKVRTRLAEGRMVYGRYLILSIGQKEPEVLDRFHLAVGGLGIVYRYPHRTSNRYAYRATGSKVEPVWGLIKPYLSIHKLTKGEEAISYFNRFNGFTQEDYTQLLGSADYYQDRAGDTDENEK